MQRINQHGIEQIRQFLAAEHRHGPFTLDQLYAWAEQAEAQLEMGNPPTIELRAWEARRGYTLEYEIDQEGFDTINP